MVKRIEGYENYTIDQAGNVSRFGKVLKPRESRTGYLHLGLYKNRVQKEFTIHRLLAKAFIPNPNNFTDVDHIDGNTLNNNLQNLQWLTHADNLRKGKNTKLTLTQAKEIKYGYQALTHKKIAYIFKVDRSLVSYIRSGQKWANV